MRNVSRAQRLLEGLRSLPAPSGAPQRLLALAFAEPPRLPALAEAVRCDPALALELVRLAPPADPRKESGLDLARAAREIAPAQLRLLACTATDSQDDRERAGDEHTGDERCGLTALRRWSVATAVAARELASNARGVEPETAYAAGLLAGIGRIAVAVARPDESAELRARLEGRSEKRLVQLERELLGLDHESVGIALAEIWNLPEELCDVLGFGERSAEQFERDCPRETRELVGLVRVAQHLATQFGFPAVDGLRAEPPSADVLVLLEGRDMASLAEPIRREVARAARELEPRETDLEAVASRMRAAKGVLASLLANSERRRQAAESVNIVLQDGLQRLGDGDALPGVLYRAMESMGFRRIAHLEADGKARTLSVVRALALGRVPRLREGAWVPFPADTRAFGTPAVIRIEEGAPEHQLLLELLGCNSCVIAPLGTSGDQRCGYLCADRGPLGFCGVEGEERCLGIIADQARLLLDFQALTREKERMATQDPLTGAATRRRLMDRLDALVLQGRQTRLALSLCLMDLDHFKKFNDTLGHQVGDRLLQDLVEVVGAQVRKGDLVARYGGEEFVVVLPSCDVEGAVRSAEKIREAVFAFGREHASEYGELSISISIGVATLAPEETPAALIGRADAALYQAKHNGRNRVELAS